MLTPSGTQACARLKVQHEAIAAALQLAGKEGGGNGLVADPHGTKTTGAARRRREHLERRAGPELSRRPGALLETRVAEPTRGPQPGVVTGSDLCWPGRPFAGSFRAYSGCGGPAVWVSRPTHIPRAGLLPLSVAAREGAARRGLWVAAIQDLVLSAVGAGHVVVDRGTGSSGPGRSSRSSPTRLGELGSDAGSAPA